MRFGNHRFYFLGAPCISELALNALTLYSNPARESFRIDNVQLSNGQLQGFDSKGQLLIDQAYLNKNEIDVQRLPVGLYLVVLRDTQTGIACRTMLLKE